MPLCRLRLFFHNLWDTCETLHVTNLSDSRNFKQSVMQSTIQQTNSGRPALPAGETAHLLVKLAHHSGINTHDASEEFFDRLKRVVTAFAQALEETDTSVTFRNAAFFSLQARAHRRPSTQADLRSYIKRMCNDPLLADKPLRSIKIPQCRNMLQTCFGHSPHTYRKAQSVLHSIFNFGIRQGWCSTNPAKAILRPPVDETRIEILTLQQIRSLLDACRLPSLACMNSAVRLMLWCGIRPTEVQRLHWSDVDPEEKLVYVEGRNSKTGGARAVPLRGGALLLAQLSKTAHGKIAPPNWERLWQKTRKKAGFSTWQNDALRHTFASMHLKRFHNIALLQEEMGHRNAGLLQTRYLNLRALKKNSAMVFFQEEPWKG